MKPRYFILFGAIILILNAGITLVLMNSIQGRGPIAHTMFSAPDVPCDSTGTSRANAITRAVAEVEPAVVSVNVIQTQYVRVRVPSGIFFDFFGIYDRERIVKHEVESMGSGVIYDPQGYIITNAHVVAGAARIKVVLPDHREFDADIVGMDPENDIAKLKIRGNNLPYARLGDSSQIMVGEWSIAVGNPYGYALNDVKPSVSVGVISALSRNLDTGKQKFYNLIQTDTAINQGNSGGPLVNIHGEVIGINTVIISETGGNIGLGFAVPINTAKRIVDSF